MACQANLRNPDVVIVYVSEISRIGRQGPQSLFLTDDGPVVIQGAPLLSGTADVPPFDREALITALRIDQAGNSTFPEFLAASWHAGVVRYDVDFDRRVVTYYGCQGQELPKSIPPLRSPEEGHPEGSGELWNVVARRVGDERGADADVRGENAFAQIIENNHARDTAERAKGLQCAPIAQIPQMEQRQRAQSQEQGEKPYDVRRLPRPGGARTAPCIPRSRWVGSRSPPGASTPRFRCEVLERAIQAMVRS